MEEGSADQKAYEKYAAGMLEMDGAKNSNLMALPPSTTKRDVADDYDNID